MAIKQENLYVRTDDNAKATGISFCPNENCLKSLRKMIAQQMFIPGREVIIYFSDTEEVRRISPFDLEEAKNLNQRQRKKFLDGVINEVRFAERVAISDSQID